MAGEFTLILGPMASGKSIALIAELDRYEHAHKKVMTVHSTANVREDDVESRIGLSRKALKVEKLSDLAKQVNMEEVDVVGVDEMLMFDPEDSFNTIKDWLFSGKIVVASSVDMLGNGSLSKTVKRLLELVPDVRYEKAVCEECDAIDARFTKVSKSNGEPTDRKSLPDVIPQDGTYIYKPVCRRCFYK
ncbi:MAG: hypothetical protein UX29_C0008G0003 [Parcubacteria group bacterium GW2011_GWA2_46_10]|nr:MAG: hypothetical protein UX29_C0008G0003 [Parcubacteria group bacterium GW2011_GWA2_46_10]